MEGIIDSGKIIFLTDFYGYDAKILHESLENAGFDLLNVSLQDDDFLPFGVYSIYQLMAGYAFYPELTEKPVYYNEITVPELWTVDAKERSYGKITYLHQKKADIHFVEGKNLFVKSVDWLDRNNVIRLTEHYNKYGLISAKTIYDNQGKAINKTWLSPMGKEILHQNILSGHFIYKDENIEYIGDSLLNMAVFYFKYKHLDKNRIFYNRLSMPYFVTKHIDAVKNEDVLFWQEKVGNEIPGNMRQIFAGEVPRTKQVIVQNAEIYDHLLNLGAPAHMLNQLGYIYPFVRENNKGKDVLICTSTDQIEHLEEWVREFPQVHFHVAAQTEMSNRLWKINDYENVSLYPGAKESTFDMLFEKCSYYFDINAGKEILSAVYRAFLNNMVILAYQETMHESDYMDSKNISGKENTSALFLRFRELLNDSDELQRSLLEQHKKAMSTKKEEYVEVL